MLLRQAGSLGLAPSYPPSSFIQVQVIIDIVGIKSAVYFLFIVVVVSLLPFFAFLILNDCFICNCVQ